MSAPSNNARLKVIYDKIPAIACQGLCVNACGPVPVHPNELKQIRRAAGRRVRAHSTPAIHIGDHLVLETKRDMHCTLLRGGRCTIYENRPLICRLYGVSDGLTCPFGCQPERLLSHAEVEELIRELCMDKTAA